MEKIMIQALLQVLQVPAEPSETASASPDGQASDWQVPTRQTAATDPVSATSQLFTIDPSSFWIDAVSTNSREIAELTAAGRHTLFVPIVGERVDAHRFIQSAMESGATATFASTTWLHTEAGQALLASGQVTLLSGLPASAPETSAGFNEAGFFCIEVEDTLAALQRLAAWYRSLFDIPVIGITGSVGKTTTKEMVAAALESALTIHKTAGNQNSQVGLPLTLFGLERHHQAAVIEMGMSEFGEMSRLAAMARPDHAVITNIGVAHIGNLGSQENIRSEKLHITDFFHEGSVLFLNADDPLLAECQKLLQNKEWSSHFSSCLSEKSLRLFGIDEKKPDLPEASGFYATDTRVSGTGQEFLLHYPGGTPVPIKLQVLGLHNVRNALAALTIAWQLGIPSQTAGKGLASYAPLAMRGNLIEAGGIQILDDSYNASPDSMKSSIEVLASLPLSLPAARRFVVFADVMELGERSETLHREVGAFLAVHNRKAIDQMEHASAANQNAPKLAPMDYLITVGTQSRFIQEGYQTEASTGNSFSEKTVPEKQVDCHHFEHNTEVISFLSSALQKGDAVLVKGSRGMKTEEIVAALKQDKAEKG